MKTTQILAALFPLAVLASNHEGHEGHDDATSTIVPTAVDTSVPTSSTGTAAPTATGSGNDIVKDLGCYKIAADRVAEYISAQDGSVYVNTFNSRGVCALDTCRSKGYRYAASMGNKCFCADDLDKSLVATTEEGVCNIPCPGYALDACGGAKAITLYENVDYEVPGGDDDVATATATDTTLTYAPSSAATSGSTSGTASTTGSAPVTTKTGGPVEAGASSLAAQSVTLIMAVCGAVFFL